ncbi:hypothetical protein OTU49_008472 [Cherax quadricarinatus]|uniref:Uncharacterized protein n=1 Tax=Cherax quadricarinatus TaxID=27406 RepID=A0AAW0WCZ2_CHEQU
MDGVEYESREDVDDTECSTSAEMDGMEYAGNTGVDDTQCPTNADMHDVEYAANTDVDEKENPISTEMDGVEYGTVPYSNYVEQMSDRDLEENIQNNNEEFYGMNENKIDKLGFKFLDS